MPRRAPRRSARARRHAWLGLGLGLGRTLTLTLTLTLTRLRVRVRIRVRIRVRVVVLVRGGVPLVDATVARAQVHADREQRQLRLAGGEAVLGLVVLWLG